MSDIPVGADRPGHAVVPARADDAAREATAKVACEAFARACGLDHSDWAFIGPARQVAWLAVADAVLAMRRHSRELEDVKP